MSNVYKIKGRLDSVGFIFTPESAKLIISQDTADEIIKRIDSHIEAGYGTAFDGTFGDDCPKGSYSRLEDILKPLNVEVRIDE